MDTLILHFSTTIGHTCNLTRYQDRNTRKTLKKILIICISYVSFPSLTTLQCHVKHMLIKSEEEVFKRFGEKAGRGERLHQQILNWNPVSYQALWASSALTESLFRMWTLKQAQPRVNTCLKSTGGEGGVDTVCQFKCNHRSLWVQIEFQEK